MSNSKIPSPARSLGVISTPRRHRFRRSHSVGSPARLNISSKLSYNTEERRLSPFILSSLKARRSVLSDNTYIEVPGRQSWYKRLDDNTGEVVEVLERREQVENVEEYIGGEILSQEKKNYTIDLPESSDGESICSIVIPQRKLFSLKDNLQAQKLFNNVMENRENFTLRKSKSNNDKTIVVGKKDLFNRVTKERSKSIFTANMQNVAIDNTLPNKTKDIENQGKVRNLFGNRVPDKRKNMFAEFIVSESEDEIPDIQPKVFGFSTNNEQPQPQTKNSRQSTIQRVHNTSIGSYISNDELDDWKLLPSSTMVENEFSITEKGTPVKRLRLSERNKTRVLAEDNNINEVNKSKQSTVTPTVKNALKSKFTNDKQFIVSQNSYINESKNSEATINKSNKNLTKKNTSKNVPNNEISINVINTNNVTTTSQNSNHDSQNDSFEENIENNNVDENNFTLQYDNDEENLPESILDENNVTLQHFEDCNSGASCRNTSRENNKILTSNSQNNIIDTNLIKSTNMSLNEKGEKETAISEMQNKTSLQIDLNDNSRDSSSFEMQRHDKNVSSSSKVVAVEQEHLLATNVQKNNMREVNERPHSPLAANLTKNDEEEPEVLDYIDENNRKRNCSNHNLGNENIKNISKPSVKEFVNINEGEDDIDSNITIQSNVELQINQNEKENSYKSNHETIYYNNIHDVGDKFDESFVKLGENHENGNLKMNVEENVDSNINDRNSPSEIKGVEEHNEENYQNNESDRDNTELEENQEEGEINDTETDTENQLDDIESEQEDESEDDNIDNSNMTVEAQQEEDNEMNSTEKVHNYSLENEKHDEEDSEDNPESNADNPEDDDEDGDDNDEMLNENFENADEQNAITDKGQRISHISSISGQSSRMFHDDVTMESDHDTSRTERSATMKTYLLKMKKANMEKRRQTEVAIRNSIKASAPVREYNLFKAPVKPKTSQHPQARTSQSKPKVKHLSRIENLPLELMEDLQYKPPRRYQPGNAAWITKRLYKYLEDKLEPKYDYKARVRAEKLVESINNFARELRRHSVAPPDAVTRLKTEMARLGVTKTHYAFYEFFHEFMPREIRVKVVPDVVNKISLPKDGIFSDILS